MLVSRTFLYFSRVCYSISRATFYGAFIGVCCSKREEPRAPERAK